jgi:signal peptidase I
MAMAADRGQRRLRSARIGFDRVSAFLRGVVWLMVVGGIVYGALRATCIRIWTFPSDDKLLSASVRPTLEAGDVLLLWRLGAPSFGDLVRCPDPEAVGRFVVGRQLGQAHDVVELNGASVLVNGRAIQSTHACRPSKVMVPHPRTGSPVELRCDFEEVNRGEFPRLSSESSEGSALVRAEVGPERVYLVSDNRYFHDDSRDFGSLLAASCNEQVLLRLWSARGWFDAERRFSLVR